VHRAYGASRCVKRGVDRGLEPIPVASAILLLVRGATIDIVTWLCTGFEVNLPCMSVTLCDRGALLVIKYM
jgi:hypothetical protein